MLIPHQAFCWNQFLQIGKTEILHPTVVWWDVED